ncbi:hypothetical protein E4U21_001112 [Claviceps maximensis]|nr:hypothetical protein E4U21_001112 [Claviceps maximensis]
MLFVALLGLAALATATPVDSIEDYMKSLESRDAITVNGISLDELNNIKFFAQHAAASYCNYKAEPGSPVTCDKSACPVVENNKVTIVNAYDGSTTGLSAYVSLDLVRKEIVLALRGSDSLRNFVTDMFFFWHDCHFTDGCKVHAGFSKAWREIRDACVASIKAARDQHPDFRVIATGHSLGGAGAVLAVADLLQDGIPVDLYTYGCPRVGNDHFTDWITGQPGAHYRVTHSGDPVARMPPVTFGYRHMSPEYWFTSGGANQDDPDVEVKVCYGIRNLDCNGGTWGVNYRAHLHYFGETAACLGNPLKWKRSDSLNDELEQRLMDWSQQDIEFVKNSQ